MREYLNKKGDFVEAVEGFDSLNPKLQDLVVHLADNATEAALQMHLAEEGGSDKDLFSGAAKNHITHILVPRIIYATKQGLTENQIVSAVEKGFKFPIPHQ